MSISEPRCAAACGGGGVWPNKNLSICAHGTQNIIDPRPPHLRLDFRYGVFFAPLSRSSIVCIAPLHYNGTVFAFIPCRLAPANEQTTRWEQRTLNFFSFLFHLEILYSYRPKARRALVLFLCEELWGLENLFKLHMHVRSSRRL